MSGKDLLAVLAMTVPSFLLIVLIAISLLPTAKVADSQTGINKVRVAGDASARSARVIAAQGMIRDFWGRPYCASCVQVSETAK